MTSEKTQADQKRANVRFVCSAFCEQQQRERLNDDSITGLTPPVRTARHNVTCAPYNKKQRCWDCFAKSTCLRDSVAKFQPWCKCIALMLCIAAELSPGLMIEPSSGDFQGIQAAPS